MRNVNTALRDFYSVLKDEHRIVRKLILSSRSGDWNIGPFIHKVAFTLGDHELYLLSEDKNISYEKERCMITLIECLIRDSEVLGISKDTVLMNILNELVKNEKNSRGGTRDALDMVYALTDCLGNHMKIELAKLKYTDDENEAYDRANKIIKEKVEYNVDGYELLEIKSFKGKDNRDYYVVTMRR